MVFFAPPLFCRRQRGFTLMELVTVIIVTGILAAVALPRFFTTQTFTVRGYADQTMAMLRYGQKLAIAQRRTVFVCFTSGGVALGYDAACATPVPGPGGTPLNGAAPSGVTISPATAFHFDAGGRSSLAATTNYQLTGGAETKTITVERETGYVHFQGM